MSFETYFENKIRCTSLFADTLPLSFPFPPPTTMGNTCFGGGVSRPDDDDVNLNLQKAAKEEDAGRVEDAVTANPAAQAAAEEKVVEAAASAEKVDVAVAADAESPNKAKAASGKSEKAEAAKAAAAKAKAAKAKAAEDAKKVAAEEKKSADAAVPETAAAAPAEPAKKAAPGKECVSCKKTKTKSEFSANQWKKASKKPPTCKACTA